MFGRLAICNDDLKEELVMRFTNGRTPRSSEMDVRECQALINYLQALVNKTFNDPADRMRKKILSICHEMGWELPNGKIDWDRLNGYLTKYGYLHKELNDYTNDELPTLVTQFENLLKSYYDAAGKR